MTKDEILAALQPWRESRTRPAWKPVVAEGEADPAASKFCGLPWTGPDAPWPNCGHCHQPLTPFLQIDLGLLPAELGTPYGTGLLQLFYCMRDECQGYGGWEPFADDLHHVRVIQPAEENAAAPAPPGVVLLPEKPIVDWTREDDLPSTSEHEEVGLTYTYDFKKHTLRIQCPEFGVDVTNPLSFLQAEEIAVSNAGDKLAGWPMWIQGVEYPHCPRCERRMVLVFQADSEDNIPFMFGDVGCAYITQCPEHKDVVAFSWSCS